MATSYQVVTLPGDGTGPEVMTQAKRVLAAVEAAGVARFRIEEIPCGGQYYLAHGDADWPAGSEERCAAADVILLGAVGWPAPDGSGPVKPRDGKKRVTCIVKDNVLRGCQFFHEVFREVGAGYPDVEKDVAIVDAFTQWLVGQPEYYDVCVTTNMFGDIVTDLASVLQGGMGMAVGCNVGDRHAMFEPIHGSAPKHAGKDKVNPTAMILATAEALRWLGARAPGLAK